MGRPAPTLFMVLPSFLNPFARSLQAGSASNALRWLLVSLLLLLVSQGCGKAGTSTDHDGKAEAFGFFRTLEERAPKEELRHIEQILRENGARLPLTDMQFVDVHHDGMWAFKAGKDVCLAQDPLGAVTCIDLKVAETEGVFIGVFTPPISRRHFLLQGIVPNGIDAVLVRIGGKRKTIPVVANAFSLAARRPLLLEKLK
jgi:hypothetical protein